MSIYFKTPTNKKSPSFKNYENQVLKRNSNVLRFFDNLSLEFRKTFGFWAITNGSKNQKMYDTLQDGMTCVFIGLEEIVISTIVKIPSHPSLVQFLWGDKNEQFSNIFVLGKAKTFKCSKNRIGKIFKCLGWQRRNMCSYKITKHVDTWAKSSHKKYIKHLELTLEKTIKDIQALKFVNLARSTITKSGGIYVVRYWIDSNEYIKIGKYSSGNFCKRMSSYIKECPTNDPSRTQINQILDTLVQYMQKVNDEDLCEKEILKRIGKADYGNEYFRYSPEKLVDILKICNSVCINNL